MDPSSWKTYQGTEFTVAEFYNTYLCSTIDPKLWQNMVFFPVTKLWEELLTGKVRGKSLAIFTVGPVIIKLMACSKFFETVSVLEFNVDCRQELEKWLRNEPGSLDWSDMARLLLPDNCDVLKEKVRECLKCVVPCKLSGDRLVIEGSVPQSDCILSIFGLESMSSNQEAYNANMKILSSFLNPGGQLMLFGTLSGTFFKVGKNTFKTVTYNESFLRKTLNDNGFAIQSMEVRDREHTSNVISFDKVFYVRAVKRTM